MAALVRVGSIVRVPLAGRKVRGFVVDDDVEPAVTERLLALIAFVSEGPPPPVVELSEWIAWRWCGPRIAVLRSASPPNNVRPATTQTRSGSAYVLPTTHTRYQKVVRRGPLVDRRDEVDALCATDGSTIVVVADGTRARGLAANLSRRGHEVAYLHSDASDAERTDAWRRATRGGCVVVGGRIAVLAPVPDLAAAIVADDADEALQEERVPTWHAREVLLERAARAGAAFTLLSPAPTVEALAEIAGPLDAPARDVEVTGWPRTVVVDRREEPPGARVLTEPFAAAARNAKLAVCVVNRRGRFRLLACGSCHQLARWERNEDRPTVCEHCGATNMRVLRAGVTRLREELEAFLPGRRVVDVDAETGALPDAADLLIGTEAVLHRGDVRRRRPDLVAFLDLDQELFAPRYRAAAQAHWLVTRGAQLLAGQPRHDTMLLLQTRAPEHEVVRAVVEGDPAIVADAETARRRALAYPPFGALAELTGDDDAVAATADALREIDEVTVLGPSDGRALVRAPDWDALADHLAEAAPIGRSTGRLRIAVDPPRI